MTATTSAFAAYMRAFAAHFASSKSPVRATESSHDWYATRNRPARKPRSRSTKVIA